MLLHSVIVNFILFFLGALLFKKWGYKLSPTCITAILFYGTCSLIRDDSNYALWVKLVMDVLYIAPSIVFVFVCLQRQERIKLLTHPFFLIEVFMIILTTVIFVIHKSEVTIVLLSTLIIGPVAETFICHEIIFNLLDFSKTRLRILFNFFIISFVIALIHGAFNISYLLFRTLIFFLFYCLRYFFKKDFCIFMIILIHFLINLLFCLSAYIW